MHTNTLLSHIEHTLRHTHVVTLVSRMCDYSRSNSESDDDDRVRRKGKDKQSHYTSRRMENKRKVQE